MDTHETPSIWRLLWRFVRGLARTTLKMLDWTRRLVFGAVALLLLGLIVAMLMPAETVQVPDQVALVLAPRGAIVEQRTGDALQRALGEALGNAVEETLIDDLLEAIELARDDDRVQALVLDLDGMFGAHLAKLQRLARAIEDFKTSGKPVLATADVYEQSRYHLASQADEIYLHELGMVYLEGYGRFRTYMKRGLDRYGLDWNVFRVGAYKSAVEPYLRDDMSPEAREANEDWLGDLWSAFTSDVETARRLDEGAVDSFAAAFAERLGAAGGDTARAAADASLVDHVVSHDALETRLIELVGDDGEGSFSRIGHDAYLEAMAGVGDVYAMDESVGLIVARGTIVGGRQPGGTIGSTTVAEKIRRARRDDAIKALVVRLDTGGGSVFASEVIRRELALFKEAGKPVVASMGSYAASGGYWVASVADEIWATRTTVTGSIGVWGVFPTVDRALDRYLGVRVDGIGTTPLSGSLRPDRPLHEATRASFQLGVEDSYRRFVALVADARGMTLDQAEAVAGGRVWSGADAAQLGLVDRLGDLDEAIAAAAVAAGLDPEGYDVELLEEAPSLRDELAAALLARAHGWWPRLVTAGDAAGAPERPLARWLLGVSAGLELPLPSLPLDDPRGFYADCLCRLEP